MNHPEVTTRRIAVILGPGGASRYLLDQLGPLLATDRDIELQGMFFREANVQHAAELPFVKELCRVTFAVREFDTGQFERALALRMRTARKALAVLADRTGVSHTFLDVRGSAVGLLKKAIDESDITAFEPARPPLAQAIQTGKGVAHGRRIAALLCNSATGESVLRTAAGLAGGDLNSLAVLIFPEPDESPGALRALYRDHLEGEPGHVRLLTQGGFNDLALTLRGLFASMLVVPATPAMTSDKSLQFLREQVRSPVCVVREWEE